MRPDECNQSYMHGVEGAGAPYLWAKTPNFSSRRGENISAIVIHHTGQMAVSPTLKLMTSLESKVSAHIVIPRNKEEGIIQLVDFKMKAWHSGKAMIWKEPNVNLFSVGLQLVGTKDSGYTDWQYEASARVCADLMNQEPGITLNRIVGHDAIAERENGPGPFWKWDRFFDTLVRRLYGLEIERE